MGYFAISYHTLTRTNCFPEHQNTMIPIFLQNTLELAKFRTTVVCTVSPCDWSKFSWSQTWRTFRKFRRQWVIISFVGCNFPVSPSQQSFLFNNFLSKKWRMSNLLTFPSYYLAISRQLKTLLEHFRNARSLFVRSHTSSSIRILWIHNAQKCMWIRFPKVTIHSRWSNEQ